VSLLEAFEVSYRERGQFLALDAVSLAVGPGEIYCLLGAAGAGKTRLLHCFLGFTRPTAGHVLVDGLDVLRQPMVSRRKLTYISRGAALYRSMSAFENVRFFTRVDGSAHAFATSDFCHAMRRVGIAERHFHRAVRDLGPAVSVLIWLAIGLLRNTPILLFDEPTAGLDLYASADLQETLHHFRQQGKAMLIATSDVLLAGSMADRVGFLKDGRKGIELSRAELVGRSLPQLFLEYMGRPLTIRCATREERMPDVPPVS
jgi:ABC-2 type transport system ATP-binding protein